MNNPQILLFELIQVALGNRMVLSRSPSSAEWKQLYSLAKKQTLIGICFGGIERLPKKQCPPKNLLIVWFWQAELIKKQNQHMDEYTKNTLEFFRSKGFPCMVLKGQGIAQLYNVGGSKSPKDTCFDLSSYRQSGDIDVWLAGGRAKIYQLSLDTLGKITGANYHHIHFPMYEKVEIEAHIYPSFLSSPFYNKTLHKFCTQYTPTEDCADTPPLAFNRVFIMLHCYRHLCGHGVGLRQLMDLYFVLLQGCTEEERKESMQWIEKFGMRRFASAAMWLFKEKFGMKNCYMLCKPNENDGRFLLNEVMQTGNMGHADKRVDRGMLNSAVGRFVYNLKRDMKVVGMCTQEALWEPWFNMVLFVVTRFIWKRKYNLE